MDRFYRYAALFSTLYLVGCGQLADQPGALKLQNERQPREIINGVLVPEDQNREVVALYRGLSGDELLCTGVLLNSRVVLTAAHCVTGLNRDEFYVGFEGRSIRVSAIIRHQYDGLKNDLALLRLSKLALLPRYPVLRKEHISVGTQVTAVGFGRDEDWQFGVKKRGKLKKKAYVPDVKIGVYDPGTIKEQRACFGDSGGPILFRGTIVGVVHGGRSDCGGESLYTSVPAHFNWIRIRSYRLSQSHQYFSNRVARTKSDAIQYCEGRGGVLLTGKGVLRVLNNRLIGPRKDQLYISSQSRDGKVKVALHNGNKWVLRDRNLSQAEGLPVCRKPW